MTLKATRFSNLFLAGVLTDNEFGGFVAFHSVLCKEYSLKFVSNIVNRVEA